MHGVPIWQCEDRNSTIPGHLCRLVFLYSFHSFKVLSSKSIDFTYIEQRENITACLDPSQDLTQQQQPRASLLCLLLKGRITHRLLLQPMKREKLMVSVKLPSWNLSPLTKNARPLNIILESAMGHTPLSTIPKCIYLLVQD